MPMFRHGEARKLVDEVLALRTGGAFDETMEANLLYPFGNVGREPSGTDESR